MFSKEDFEARISTAGAQSLVVITYDIALGYLQAAIDTSDDGEFQSYVKKAQSAVDYLIGTLDMQYEISISLARTYFYINKLIVEAYFSKSKKPAQDAAELLAILRSGWDEANKSLEGTESARSGAEVFVGLTYGDSGLNEYVKNDNEKDFLA